MGKLPSISFAKQAGIKHRIFDFVEDYFYIGGKKAFVISKNKLNGNYLIEIKDNPQNRFKKIILTALKIASWVTVIIPLLMYVTRFILRKTNHFQLKNSSIIEFIPPIRPGIVRDKEIFVFGDIHGELDGFKENLSHAKVIDGRGNFNKNFKDIVIQMGDVVDRGPKSKEAWAFLQKLQASARSGQIIRLLGNHELMLLQKDYGFANYPEPAKLASEIKKDILAGKVQLSYFDGMRLFTHAGLRSSIRNYLIAEIKEKKKTDSVSVQDITNYMNEILKEAVKKDKYDHPIFRVSERRGGPYQIGGPLWDDVSDLMQSAHARDIPQVIAHNPPRYRGDAPIRITDSLRLINVDAGLCNDYGGHKAYVKIGKNSELEVYEKIKEIWKKRVLEVSRIWNAGRPPTGGTEVTCYWLFVEKDNKTSFRSFEDLECWKACTEDRKEVIGYL
ncbi:hypothetical protein LCGC14_2092570, partial [marine sediment metagenome]